MNYLFLKYYEYLFRIVFNKPNFKFRPTPVETKQLENFVDFLLKEVNEVSIGEKWVFDYVVYLFNERMGQDTGIKDKMPLNWVFGQKAFGIYQKKPENWLYYNGLFVKRYKVGFLNLEAPKAVKSSFINEYEDNLRRAYIKDSHPLSLCRETVPFCENSQYCSGCVDNGICKLINN